MSIRMLIDASHREETRVAIVDGNQVEEFDYESSAKKQLKGSIYLAKVTRVEPSLQAAFVDYGGNRHGFLAFSEIHPDYYQIPVADREALIAEEAAANADLFNDEEEEEEEKKSSAKEKSPRKTKAEKTKAAKTKITEIEDDGTESEAANDKTKDDKIIEEVVTDTNEDKKNNDSEQPSKDEEQIDAKEELNDDASREEDTGVTSEEEDEEKLRIKMAKRLRYKYKIQEVIKKNQIILIQVVKEERGNKGAALTTYLSLPGRYCVLMPNTLHGGGVSRKIANVRDRKKLKDMLSSLNLPKGHACIIRTAGNNRTKPEIKRDYDYLKRTWEAIRELTLKSIAPSLIYEEGDLIKRTIRDLYTREVSEILVEGERGYKTALDFMSMLMPSHAKKIQHYVDPIPLFQRYRVETHLNSMFTPTAQLKSGGYIVINPTEALVSIDVNSGRATKEHNIEETAVKTNLEAAEEVARQLKLRDMAGLVVIDFIDMEDQRNNRAVERKMKSCLKSDRARIQVGRISSFGLMEMSRQRLRVGVLESSTTPCPHCEGSGLLRSVESQSLHILRIIEEEGIRAKNSKFTVYLPSSVAVYILNNKRLNLIDLEKRYDFSVSIAIDNELTASAHRMEKSGKPSQTAQKRKNSLELGKDVNKLIDVTEEDVSPDEGGKEKPKRRRRRKRNQYNKGDNETSKNENSDSGSDVQVSEKTDVNNEKSERSNRRRRPRRNRRRNNDQPDTNSAAKENTDQNTPVRESVGSSEVKDGEIKAKKEPRKSRAKAAPKENAEKEPTTEAAPKEATENTKVKPKTTKKAAEEKTPEVNSNGKSAGEDKKKTKETRVSKAAGKSDEPPKDALPKKKGWWSRAIS